MKKIIITLVSFIYVISGFCQTKVLYLKSKESVRFQTWDTLYASVRKNIVVLTDSKGNSHKLKLGKEKNGSDASIMLLDKEYHFREKPDTSRSGCVIMDNKMKLFFENKSVYLTTTSSFVHHYSHYSYLGNSGHHSHSSHISHYSSAK